METESVKIDMTIQGRKESWVRKETPSKHRHSFVLGVACQSHNIHSFLLGHFIKKAVIVTVKAGNPGHLNSVASKRPNPAKGQS